IDEANKEIYGSQYVNPDFAVSQGIIGYTRSIEEAAKNPRVAGNPLVIKALRVSGNMKADIVISAVDAERLEKLKNTLKFFSECRVMVIL
ncbi:MAG: hypothetical protein HY934_03040, partial [Candidatus Firestonebacteria bacterium]|nr:hypothetical protein [Candidatus Firestonebacteria bacterium]